MGGGRRCRVKAGQVERLVGAILVEAAQELPEVEVALAVARVALSFVDADADLRRAAITQLGRRDDRRIVEQYREALRRLPNRPEIHFNLGIVLVRLGQIPKAIAEFQEALRLKPDYAEARQSLDDAQKMPPGNQ